MRDELVEERLVDGFNLSLGKCFVHGAVDDGVGEGATVVAVGEVVDALDGLDEIAGCVADELHEGVLVERVKSGRRQPERDVATGSRVLAERLEDYSVGWDKVRELAEKAGVYW